MPPARPPRPVLTHFLCLPLVTPASRPQLSESLASFHADVTNASSFSVPEEAVRPLGTLHLTIGMMSFPTNEGLNKAVELLKALKPREILSTVKSPVIPGQVGPDVPKTAEQLSITLRGLQSLQSASKASVLYAPPVDPEGILQQFCEKLRFVFQEANLLVAEDRPLLLHATIINTVYVKGGHDKRKGEKGKRRDRLTIDARGILDRYEDWVWMDNANLEKIAICKMGAVKTEVDSQVVDEAYEVVAEIDF